MDRKSGGSGNEIRESIVLLCRIFKYGDLFHDILPEHIRQAKFDKPNVIRVLLGLLYKLMDIEEPDLEAKPAQHNAIHAKLKICRYPRLNYLCDEQGKLCSSREILLAIAWYINCARVIDTIKDHALKPVDLLSASIKVTEKNRKNPAKQQTKTMTTAGTLADKANYITWLVARINFIAMQIGSLEEGNAKRRCQISANTKLEIKDDPSLLLLLRHKPLAKECEKQLERKIHLLQTYIQWKKSEHVFWLWMDSVLLNASTMRLSNDVQMPNDVQMQVVRTDSQPAQSCLSLKQSNVFRQKMAELEQELNTGKTKHAHNLNERTGILAEIAPEQRLEIDKEITLMRERLEDPYARPVIKCVDEYYGHGTKIIPVTWEIERLKTLTSALEKQVREIRLQANEKLTACSQIFVDVVMIPPTVPRPKPLRN